MLVSVIIPVYNVEKYILECLASVGSQVLNTDVECFIVDDCGSDHSIDIVNRFIESYKGSVSFKIVHHDINRGLSAARNTGIREASGEYLYFMDSDDRFYSNDSLELLCNLVKVHPGIDMVQGNFAGKNNYENMLPMTISIKNIEV